jgi:hypothetical protein
MSQLLFKVTDKLFMKNVIIIFCFFAVIQPVRASADDMLILQDIQKGKTTNEAVNSSRDSGKKKYKIVNTIIDDKFIQIIGEGNHSCKIPIEALISDSVKRARCDCGVISQEEQQETKSNKDIFQNAHDYSVFCLTDGEDVISYNFIGQTVINKVPSAINSAKIFNLQAFPMQKEVKPNEFSRQLGSLSNAVINWFIRVGSGNE